MKWFIGVDGGGTKTAVAVSLPDGKPVAETVREGCSYQMLGVDGAVTVIIEGVHSIPLLHRMKHLLHQHRITAKSRMQKMIMKMIMKMI